MASDGFNRSDPPMDDDDDDDDVEPAVILHDKEAAGSTLIDADRLQSNDSNNNNDDNDTTIQGDQSQSSHQSSRIEVGAFHVPITETNVIENEQAEQQQNVPEPVNSRVELASMIADEMRSDLVDQVHQPLRDEAPPLVDTVHINSEQEDVGSLSDDPKNVRENPRSKSSITICLIVLVVIVIGLIIGFLIARGDNNSDNSSMAVTVLTTSSPTASPTGAPTDSIRLPNTPAPLMQPAVFYDIMEFLKPSLMGPPTFFEESSFLNTSAVQYQVLDWMANVDTETKRLLRQINIPTEDLLRMILERYCVYSLYLRWGGSGWVGLTAVNLPTISVCDWKIGTRTGFWCDPDGYVAVVDFFRNNLRGPLLPLELFHFKRLGNLVLGENNLEGTISPMLSQYFPNLSVLELSGMRVTGTIPTELGLVSHLILIFLFRASLTGTIPTELGALSKLRHLQVAANFLSGTIPTELGQLADLESFLVSENIDIRGTVPTEFVNLSKLQYASIARTSVTGNLDPIFCSNDYPFDDLQALMSECVGSSLDGTTLSKNVCSCCTSCSISGQFNGVKQAPQPSECANTDCVACDLSVFAQSCGECPALDANDPAVAVFEEGDEIPLQLCIGACSWNFTSATCEPRTLFGLEYN